MSNLMLKSAGERRSLGVVRIARHQRCEEKRPDATTRITPANQHKGEKQDANARTKPHTFDHVLGGCRHYFSYLLSRKGDWCMPILVAIICV